MTVTPPERAQIGSKPDRSIALSDPGALEQAGQDALEQGNLALAELAFLKLSAAHPSAATHAQVYEVAAARTHYALARRALEAVVDCEPNNAAALEQLALLRAGTGDATGAVDALRRALMIDPKNPALATAYAVWSQGSPDHLHEVPDLLVRAAGLDHDGTHLEQIVDALIYQQRYQDAEHYIGVIQTHTGDLSLPMMRYLGVALAGQGRPDQAREVFNAAIDACNAALPAKPPSETEWRAMEDSESTRAFELYAFRARLEHEGGQSASALGTYAILHNAGTARRLAYPDTASSDTAARLEDLRRLVGGRDLVLLCQGHSVGDFGARIGDLGNRKPVFASLNQFGVIEREILEPGHRALDVVLALGAGSIRNNLAHLKPFLQQARPTMAITSPVALAAAFDPESRAAFLTVNGPRILSTAGNALRSVTPDDPLGMIHEGTLLAALPLLVAAKPKRVFVIGADYGVSADKGTSHFAGQSGSGSIRPVAGVTVFGNSAQRRENFETAMRSDAAICDRDLTFQINATATLHGFAPPPVFNVSTGSRLQSLPKISLGDFFKMLD